ncbi:MAG: hypothetical protein HRU77_11600 [Gammaproteobacteria bacterium]|jgi:hypothetical protein|nr:hypothetical protein [Pseudomonadota bacterium]QOJ21271.1 MAG: hypothetical protein HRU77_11600 [Gammaproteobacteria bacterium]
MTTFIYDWRVPVNKVLKLSSLLLALTVLTACAQMNPSVAKSTGISSNNHDALVKYYEGIAKDAQIKLQANKKVLQEYEARPYYFGRQGLDAQSHATANVQAYEKVIQESLASADLHRKMAMEQNNHQTKMVKLNRDRDFTSKILEYPEYPGN